MSGPNLTLEALTGNWRSVCIVAAADETGLLAALAGAPAVADELAGTPRAEPSRRPGSSWGPSSRSASHTKVQTATR